MLLSAARFCSALFNQSCLVRTLQQYARVFVPKTTIGYAFELPTNVRKLFRI